MSTTDKKSHSSFRDLLLVVLQRFELHLVFCRFFIAGAYLLRSVVVQVEAYCYGIPLGA